MWNVRSLFPMNGHERNNYEDHSYGSKEYMTNWTQMRFERMNDQWW